MEWQWIGDRDVYMLMFIGHLILEKLVKYQKISSLYVNTEAKKMLINHIV